MNALIKQNKHLTLSMGSIPDRLHRTSSYTAIRADSIIISVAAHTSVARVLRGS